MSLSTCPVAVIEAPVERVWSFFDQPANYDRWWDAVTLAVIPEGPAQPGQQVLAYSQAFGRRWKVSLVVVGVDEERKQIDLQTELPLGITLRNHITCSAAGDGGCLVSFG